MPFFLCPHCRKKYRTSGKSLGKRLKCSRCGKVFTAQESVSEAMTVKQVPQDTDKLPRVEIDEASEEETVPLRSDPDATAPMAGPEARTVKKSADLSVEELEALWSGTITEDLSINATIKAEGRSVRTPSGLSISSMRLGKAGDPVTPPPHYELVEMLGQGGMGVVYTARQSSLGRTIAMKMIKGEAAKSEKYKNLFLSEAAVTGDLAHPNIVPVYDLGANDEGQLFYAMKKVEGTPWDEVIGEKTRSENLDILMRVADAVAFAHSRGVIHRDLKPENVMLGEFGEVLVMDWGMAASVSDEGKADKLRPNSAFGGTPSYMAPEMAAADMASIGPKSDVYLLGAILYEIVTGLKPHTGLNPINCIVNASQNIIQETDREGELVEIALQAMQTNPEDRYASVKDFQQAIRDYQSHQESIVLTEQAGKQLEKAEDSHDYDDYASAMFTYEQALDLWPENRAAQDGAKAARKAYAACAHEQGDLELAGNLLRRGGMEKTSLGKKIKQAIKQRQQRAKRLILFRRLTAAAAVLIIAILSGAFFWIRQKEQRALDAEAQAREDRQVALDAKQEAEQEREAAEVARADTEEKRQQAEEAKEREEEERLKAEASRKTAEEEAERAKSVTDFLTTTLASADPSQKGKEVTVCELMDIQAKQVDAKFADDPKTAVNIHKVLANTYRSLGELKKARHRMDKALALGREVYKEDSEEFGLLRWSEANLLLDEGKPKEAQKIWKALQKNANKRGSLGVINNLALALNFQGKYAEAEEMHREVLTA